MCPVTLVASSSLQDYGLYRLPDSSGHGILQARILEWVAMPSSRGSSRHGLKPHLLRLLHGQADSLPVVPENSKWKFREMGWNWTRLWQLLSVHLRSCSSSQGRANGSSCDCFTLLQSCTVSQKGLQKESLQECIIYSGSFACQTQISFGEILLPHNSTRADPLQDLQGHTPDLPFRPIAGV